MQRIGVFVCHCGTNIAATVDVKAVAEALKNEPGVVFSTDYQYMCSEAGQNIKASTIDAWHRARGFKRIGYHYVVDLDGTIERGRPVSLAGAHCKGRNAHSSR